MNNHDIFMFNEINKWLMSLFFISYTQIKLHTTRINRKLRLRLRQLLFWQIITNNQVRHSVDTFLLGQFADLIRF